MARQKQNRVVYKKKKGIWRILLKTVIMGGGLVFLAGAGVFIWFFKDLPRPEKFAEGEIPQSTKIYDSSGQAVLYEIAGEEKRTIVPFNEIPSHLKWAVVATEDKRFYEHRGLDLKAITRALMYDLKIKKLVQGASTISQQLIRSYFLTRNKTIKRKTREIILTLELERRYPKEQILDWYLNLIPFGSNLYGVESASQTFFNRPVSEISLAQAALLAALIKSPSLLWPYGENREKLLTRKDYVLEQMKKEGYITGEQLDATKEEKIEFVDISSNIKAPHFVMLVKDYLEQKYGKSFLERAGLKVTTTLNLELQEKAEQIIEGQSATLKRYNAHNAALTAINPKTGELLAMVGSLATAAKDYFGSSTPQGCVSGKTCLFDPQTNVAISPRQPGSAFKPFAYAVALQKGFTPDTLLWDAPTEFNSNCSANTLQTYDQYNTKCYHPKNYDGRFIGQLSFRSALSQSRNLPSVKVLYLAGLKQTLEFAKMLGITTLADESRYGLALVLGGGEVKLLEMTAAYGVFANDGVKASLHFIKSIEDPKGNILERAKQGSLKLMSSQIARQINDILSDNAARAPMFGWHSSLYIPDYDVAVKTGTTQQYNDAWCIGYSPNIVVGVWAGNNNNAPTEQAGVMMAGPIWNRFIQEALKKSPKEEFPEPQKEITGKPVLDGIFQGRHSILYFVNKNDPQGLGSSQADPQYWHWEYGVANY